MRNIIIDTDTASDDAVALIMAWRYPEVEVKAITVVAGNVPLEQAVQNALYTRELCRSETPVYAGAGKPLKRPLETAQFVHGQDGMGDLGLPLNGRQPDRGNAVSVLIELIRQYPGEIELVTLGPLTNLALAIERDPEICSEVVRCTCMAGIARGPGNITPVSEYNAWADPEAADMVFRSGMPLRMVGWDISRNHAFMDPATVNRIRSLDTELASFAMDIQATVNEFAKTTTQLPGFDLPDPIAMALAIDDSLINFSQQLYVEVVLAEDITRGQTVVDHLAQLGQPPNTEVVLEASRKKFLSMLESALS